MNLDTTIERTVWCAQCAHWEQESATRIAPFRKRMKARGWCVRDGRTVCKKCAEKIDNPNHTEEP